MKKKLLFIVKYLIVILVLAVIGIIMAILGKWTNGWSTILLILILAFFLVKDLKIKNK
jgi:hypothetical protein